MHQKHVLHIYYSCWWYILSIIIICQKLKEEFAPQTTYRIEQLCTMLQENRLSSRADNSETSWGICTKITSCTSTIHGDDVYQVSLQSIKNWRRRSEEFAPQTVYVSCGQTAWPPDRQTARPTDKPPDRPTGWFQYTPPNFVWWGYKYIFLNM